MLNLRQYIIPSQSSQQIYMEHNFNLEVSHILLSLLVSYFVNLEID
jgi:hypothetical protein